MSDNTDATPQGIAAQTSPLPRDAATLVLLRVDGRSPDNARVLMGQRGRGARFMPNKMVFPGGAVDAADFAASTDAAPADACRARLAKRCEPPRLDLQAEAVWHDMPTALALAAVRETFEETGLRLAHVATSTPGATPEEDESWRAFQAAPGGGVAPALDRLRFIFRAITPPGSPVRFDARFFLADAEAVLGDLDDFSGASGELSHLAWTPLAEARSLDLPFITSVVLAEVKELLDQGLIGGPDAVWRDRPAPFFRHDADGSSFEAL